jgi:hypothetical protein
MQFNNYDPLCVFGGTRTTSLDTPSEINTWKYVSRDSSVIVTSCGMNGPGIEYADTTGRVV